MVDVRHSLQVTVAIMGMTAALAQPVMANPVISSPLSAISVTVSAPAAPHVDLDSAQQADHEKDTPAQTTTANPTPNASTRATTQARLEALTQRYAEDSLTASELLELSGLYLATGAIANAEAALEKAQRQGIDFKRAAPLTARLALVQGRYSAAIAAFQGVSVTGAARTDRDIIIGDAHLGLGQYEAADAAYRTATAADPRDHRGFLGLTRIAIKRGDLKAAAKQVVYASDRAPGDTMVNFTQGLIARYSGDLSAAEAAFARAVQSDSQNILALNELASMAIARSALDVAEGYLDQIYVHAPYNLNALYLSGVIAARRGAFQDAHRLLGRADAYVRRYVPALLVRSIVAYQVQDYDIARTAAERYVRLQPASDRGHIVLGAIYIKLNRMAEASAILDAVLQTSDTARRDSETLKLAAAAAIAAGDVTRGETLLAKAAAVQSDTLADDDLLLRLGLAQFASGQQDAAQTTLQTALVSRQEDLRYFGILARMQIASGRLEAALDTTGKILDVAPDRGLGYNIRGSIRHMQGRYGDAVDDYSAALVRNPAYVTAKRNRALSYLALGRLSNAEADVKAILAETPDDARARAILGRTFLRQNKPADATEVLTTASVQLGAPPEIGVDLAKALAADGKTARAIRVARQILDDAHEQPDILRELGLIFLAVDQPEGAARALSRLRAFRPNDIDANMLYGRALLRSRLYRGAVQAFGRVRAIAEASGQSVDTLDWYDAAAQVYAGGAETAIARLASLTDETRPADISPVLIADVYSQLGDTERAIQSLEAVYAREASDLVALRLADIYASAGRSADQRRVLDAHMARTDLPGRDVMIALADILYGATDYTGAAALYEQSLGSRVVDAAVAAKLAKTYLALGRRTSARLARQARLLDPNDPDILDIYGWTILQAERNVALALPALEKAVRRSPSRPEFRYHLAMAYIAAGRQFDAVRALREALALSPDFEGADDARAQLDRFD